LTPATRSFIAAQDASDAITKQPLVALGKIFI
jgi:hypothetical protein